jgi:hypothetical protein
VKLYDRNMGSGTGISMVTKIKYDHVFLNSFSKMQVDLAAEVKLDHKCVLALLAFITTACRFLVIVLVMPCILLEAVVHLRQPTSSKKWIGFLTVSM